MTTRTLIRRSLRFHWRTHLGVALGAAIGSAALLGALVVGDSVRGTLETRALQRLGATAFALKAEERFFADLFPGDTDSAPQWSRTGPVVLHLTGGAARADGGARANRVNLYGVTPRFWRMANPTGEGAWEFTVAEADGGSGAFENPLGPTNRLLRPGEAFLNEALAHRLALHVGDELLLRVPRPNALSPEAAVSPRSGAGGALRVKVAAILRAKELGNFSLRNELEPSLNVFLNRDELQRASGLEGRANLVLLTQPFQLRQSPIAKPLRSLLQPLARLLPWVSRWTGEWHAVPLDTGAALAHLRAQLKNAWTLADLEADLRPTPEHGLELRTRRVFLDPPLVRAALGADPDARPVLTYLANLLRAGTNATPYSMVTAAGPPWTPPDMREDEILVTEWLAEDLQVKSGDALALVYFDPESGARLIERTNTFRVRGVVPMTLPWADRTLMPDFPGIEKAESTRDWDAGFPLTYQIRPKDEDYWRQWRGTPKAFITLAAGQKLWANRFGNATAIRFCLPSAQKADESSSASNKPQGASQVSPLPAGEGKGEGEPTEQPQAPETLPAHEISTLTPALSLREGEQRAAASDVFGNPDLAAYRGVLEARILVRLKPEELGLRFEPVREQALRAARESQDFGGLFLGFSVFLIAAALLLMALLFRFGLEQRAPEIGTLLALGFTPIEVRRLLLREGAAPALLGGLLGTLSGLGYAHLMLHGLNTVWHEAVGGARLDFHVTAQSLLTGLLASTAVAMATIRLALRRFVKLPAQALLAGELEHEEASRMPAAPSHRARVAGARTLPLARAIAWAALLAGMAVAGWALARGEFANAGAFFGAGALVLVAGLAAASARLIRLARGPSPLPSGEGKGEGEPTEQPQASETLPAHETSTLTLREREQPPASSGKAMSNERPTPTDKTERTQQSSPLPAGEGKGEGEPTEQPQGSETLPAHETSTLTPTFALREREQPPARSGKAAPRHKPLSLAALGVRGCARRHSRSVSTIAMLACGVFLIVSIAVFRLDAGRDAWRPDSGTGGFALMGETTMPVVHDLNTQAGRDFFALRDDELEGVRVVALRVREGDEASCLNLNRAQQPRLLGVKPELLEGRFRFVKGEGWRTLKGAAGDQSDWSDQSDWPEIPAIGDANSIRWAMKKNVGDTLDYVDERGRPFRVRIVGAVANSVLQGVLLIDEAEFVRRFPGAAGYRMFLIDAPSNRVAQVSATLSRALEDTGLELVPAAERLAQFNAVQNTYLGTFQVLGGLGLLLGSAGLGIVVLRNALERRGELALLLAVGFRRRQVQRLLLMENGALLAAGLGVGMAAAAIAVLPAAIGAATPLPSASLSLTLAGVLSNGLVWTWAATRLALRGNLLEALRNE